MKKRLPIILAGIMLILVILAFALYSNAETEPNDGNQSAEEEYLVGDFDKDGSITAQDAYKVLEFYAISSTDHAVEPTEEQTYLGDVNGDHIIDGRDATFILTYITKVAVSDEGEREMTIQEFLESRN